MFLYSCHGKAVVRKGNATSDTVCKNEDVTSTQLQNTTKEHHTGIVFMTADKMGSTVLAVSDSTLSVSPSVLKEVSNPSTEGPSPSKEPRNKLGMVTDLESLSSHHEKTVRSN